MKRGFCGRCGTQLTYEQVESLGEIELTTLSLDEPSQVPPTKEIWLSERVAWVAVDAGFEHYSRGGSGPLTHVT